MRRSVYDCKVVDIVAQYPVDCIFFGDDWGQRKGLIMGYPLWKKFIYPCLKKMYAHVEKYGKFVAQHSCGDCAQVFPDLVELGLDIYNTFQPEVYDIVDFKRRFCDKITFFGAISTQCCLPFLKPEEVKAEMHRIMDILGSSRDDERGAGQSRHGVGLLPLRQLQLELRGGHRARRYAGLVPRRAKTRRRIVIVRLRRKWCRSGSRPRMAGRAAAPASPDRTPPPNLRR